MSRQSFTIYLCFFLAAFVGISSAASQALAATIYVEPGNTCYGNSPCYSSVQPAIDNSLPDDVIKLGAGTYSENIVLGDNSGRIECCWDADFTTMAGTGPASITSLIDNDSDGFSAKDDCNDAASSCTTDCSDADGDGVADCLDLCMDVDNDNYGIDNTLLIVGGGSVAVGSCTTDGSTPCGIGDDACLDTDCHDGDENINPAAIEVCDGVDNDCDPTSTDGSEDTLVGQLCDGSDTDLCLEGVNSCVGGVISCSDNTGSSIDICNNTDDDCDPTSADGSEDPLVGQLCDGEDSDLCQEGVNNCVGGLISCGDNTDNTLDICNGIDDDCDPTSDDGSEDPLSGQACDGSDSDMCLEGVNSCVSGALSCSDNTGSTTEQCNGIDDDCDGSIDEDFNRNDNPLCSSGTYYLGSVSGDTGGDMLTDSWHDEEWDRFLITEDNNNIVYLSATVRLWSPPGVDYDLYVYCKSCTLGLAGSSSIHSLAGHSDTVNVRADDDWLGKDNSFEVVVEIRHYSSNICANWELTISGNRTVDTATCY